MNTLYYSCNFWTWNKKDHWWFNNIHSIFLSAQEQLSSASDIFIYLGLSPILQSRNSYSFYLSKCCSFLSKIEQTFLELLLFFREFECLENNDGSEHDLCPFFLEDCTQLSLWISLRRLNLNSEWSLNYCTGKRMKAWG